MSNLSSISNEMVRVWQSLRANWDETRQAWRDKDRDRFEREYIEEFSQATNSYIVSLGHLANSVQNIENEMP